MDPLFILLGFFFCVGYFSILANAISRERRRVNYLSCCAKDALMEAMQYGEIARLLPVVLARVAIRAGISTPRLTFFKSDPRAIEIDAGVQGISHQTSFVEISYDCIQELNHGEFEALFAHEIGHIANRDRLKGHLIFSFLGGFSRALFGCLYALSLIWFDFLPFLRARDFLLAIPVLLLSSVAVFLLYIFLVRRSEFRADAFAVRTLQSKEELLSLFSKIEKRNQELESLIQAMGIATKLSFWQRLKRTHPPFEARVKRIQRLKL